MDPWILGMALGAKPIEDACDARGDKFVGRTSSEQSRSLGRTLARALGRLPMGDPPAMV